MDAIARWRTMAQRAATTNDAAAFATLAAGLLKSIPERKIDYFAKERDRKRQQPFLDRIAALEKCADHPAVAARCTA